MVYSLQQSRIDPYYFEVREGEVVVQEVKVPFRIRDIPSAFHCLKDVSEWLAKTERSLAKKYAYRLLALKSYSKFALLKKLEGKYFSFLVCKELIDELELLGFLSDDAFFQALIIKMARRGYGPLYIERKIQQAGGNEKCVRDSMDVKLRKEALSKALLKLKGKSDRQRAAALFRRGFEWSDCQQ